MDSLSRNYLLIVIINYNIVSAALLAPKVIIYSYLFFEWWNIP